MSKKKHKHFAPPSHPKYFQRSPIDFCETLYHPFDLGQVGFTYPLSHVKGEVEGEGIHAKVNVVDTARIPLFGMQLKLKQLHFHSPSEHLVSGVSWPLELHLVHEIEGGQSGMTVQSNLFVISIFILGSADATKTTFLPSIGRSFTAARQSWREKAGSVVEPIEFNPNHCLPAIGQRDRFFRYEGSLTSGDLDETVSWLVFERPVNILDADMEEVLSQAEQDPRAVEMLNRRVVLRSFP